MKLIMAKQTIFLLCALVALVSANAKHPYDLADEVRDQANQLEDIVQGDILVAHDDLQNTQTAFGTYAMNVAQSGGIALQEEHDTIIGQVNTVKDLANSANRDITVCTNVREAVLNRLPTQYAEEMTDCISGITREASRILSDARYTVDVVINKVHDLQNQIRRCGGDMLCLSPLVSEIELNKIRLPQNIRTEVQAAQSLVTTLQLSVQDCSDQKVAAYATEANSILGDIMACVDRILG